MSQTWASISRRPDFRAEVATLRVRRHCGDCSRVRQEKGYHALGRGFKSVSAIGFGEGRAIAEFRRARGRFAAGLRIHIENIWNPAASCHDCRAVYSRDRLTPARAAWCWRRVRPRAAIVAGTFVLFGNKLMAYGRCGGPRAE